MKYCYHCGFEGEGFTFSRTVANGDCYDCPECNGEIVTSNEEGEDDWFFEVPEPETREDREWLAYHERKP